MHIEVQAIHVDVVSGGHISEICFEAVQLARQFGLPVSFTFNRIAVVANPTDIPGQVVERYFAGWDELNHSKGKP